MTMFDWLLSSSMIYVLKCCGENAVPIAKYHKDIDCIKAQQEIIDWSRLSKGTRAGEKDNFIFRACIKAERLISR